MIVKTLKCQLSSFLIKHPNKMTHCAQYLKLNLSHNKDINALHCTFTGYYRKQLTDNSITRIYSIIRLHNRLSKRLRMCVGIRYSDKAW